MLSVILTVNTPGIIPPPLNCHYISVIRFFFFTLMWRVCGVKIPRGGNADWEKTVRTDVTANHILCTKLSKIMHHVMYSFVRNWIRYGQIQSQRSHTAFKSLNTAVNHHQPPSLHVLSRTSISSQSTLHNPLFTIHWEILHPMPDSKPHTCLHLRSTGMISS